MRAKKKAVSGVVETVLLILISFSVIAIISGIVIPMIKNNLDKSKMMYELREYFTIENSKYTCYYKDSINFDNSFTTIMITRSNKNIDINAIIVSIRDESGTTNRYDIENGITFANVKMLTGTPILEIPALGEARTYNFRGIAGEHAKVSAETEDGTIGEPYESAIMQCN